MQTINDPANVQVRRAAAPAQPGAAQPTVQRHRAQMQQVSPHVSQGGAATAPAAPASAGARSAPSPAPQLPDGLPGRTREEDIHTVMPVGAQLTGDLTIEESIVLRCVVRGNVTQSGDHQVVLTDTGGIHGTLRANTAVIGGTVEGDVFADRVVILETGVVHGNVEYVTMAMREGAFVNGTLQRKVPNVLDPSDGASAALVHAAPGSLRAVATDERAA
ncbi:bactofilin family protein [Burkholderia ubonensis]|uniref:Polymer-forming cytoskeletal protein n=1 Tax=Burkholderia ubonensis subsp. mesacidophila TaxID=265293 RepID=A0A2A4FCH7_9BURK|nr:polymer-forming cytoskeletal protein [Burkholderia ubonensis]PCE30039.1 hypothetical protein BZL54_23020 [Burkholderia ubonensis subsp. mesacidophila]